MFCKAIVALLVLVSNQVTIHSPQIVEYGEVFELRGEIVNTGRYSLLFESSSTVNGEYVNMGTWEVSLLSANGEIYYLPLVFIRRDIRLVRLRRNKKYAFSFKIRLKDLSKDGFFRSDVDITDGEYELILKINCARPTKVALLGKTRIHILTKCRSTFGGDISACSVRSRREEGLRTCRTGPKKQ